MLRNLLAVSSVTDFTDKYFQEIIDDEYIKNKETVKKIVFCSGKVYYDILQEHLQSLNSEIAIIRIEQFYPFNEQLFNEIVTGYPNAQEFVWAQEEPKNQGAWSYLMPIITELIDGLFLCRSICFCGLYYDFKLNRWEYQLCAICFCNSIVFFYHFFI